MNFFIFNIYFKDLEGNFENETEFDDFSSSTELLNLTGLSSLEYLHVTGVILYDTSFVNLPCLKRLSITSCDFENITNAGLKCIPNLELLSIMSSKTGSKISFNELPRVKWILFELVKSLYLEIDQNPCLSVLQIFCSKLRTSLKNPNLKSLEIRLNNLPDSSLLSGLTGIQKIVLLTKDRTKMEELKKIFGSKVFTRKF